ncbi:MAG TPA: helix-turn-helix domain-containing protein [Pelovirga sp.]|nr:helix-turn-helix domain-containing protein [Pelovirga sp.]
MTKLKDPAIVALKALIKSRGLTYADLRQEIGSKGYVSLILSGERSLTKGHIQKLTARFGIPPVVFFDQQAANLFAGRTIKVPVVDLLNPDVELEPDKIDALLYDVALRATKKAQRAQKALMDNLRDAVQKAVA